MKKIVLLLLSLVAVALTGCGDDWGLFTTNPKKTPYEPPKEGEEKVVIGEISKESFRPALDILFVIDNSGSMGSHQQLLSSNITLFTDAIVKTKFLDYHIGVTNSSGSSNSFFGGGSTECCGRLLGNPNYVERNTPNGIQLLARNMLVGTGSSTDEFFFDPIVQAFSPPMVNGANAGFLRQDAYLAIIIITDTDDQSPSNDHIRTYDFLRQLKGSPDKIFVGAAFIPDNEVNTCAGESDIIKRYDRLPSFFQMTGAMTFSLCDPQYGTKLSEIGKLLASKAQTMYLKQFPEAGTISVLIGTEVLPNDPKKGWTYNPEKNALEFGTEIEWEKYPDNTFPVVNFTSIPIE